MMRLPRIVASLSLACLIGSPVICSRAWAQEATPAPAPAAGDATAAPAPVVDTTAAVAAPAAAKPLADQVADFWFAGKIARYDIAADAADKILAGSPDAGELLKAFETVAAKKGDNIDYWMLKFVNLAVPTAAEIGDRPSLQADKDSIVKLKADAVKLRDLINAGHATRAADPEYIRATIIEMSTGARAYDNNLPRVQVSGEVAAKILVDILRSPTDRQYNVTARRILRDLGKKALGPLTAATAMKDNDTLVDVVSALGDIGYDGAIPYLVMLANDPSRPAGLKIACKNALAHMGAGDPSVLRAADLFTDLSEKLYYNESSIQPSGDKTAFIWSWSDSLGLTRQDVPTPIFGDVMSMRAAEYALKLDPSKGQAVSLWLAANTKREAELPAGATDVTHKGNLDAHYYNVSAGVQFVNDALARAIKDHNAAVALRLTQALQDIVGQSNMNSDANDPLVQALFFPNRLVRYEAAFALAGSLPTKTFTNSDRVVPLLVEALSESSKPNILVVAPVEGGVQSGLRDAVTTLGYPVVGAADPTDAVNAATALPGVDLIVITEDSDVQKMIDLEQTSTRIQGASVLVLTKEMNSPFAVRSATDPLMNAAVMPAKSALGPTLKTEIDRARKHSGLAGLTEQQATDYALHAGDLLTKLAITRGQALDLSAAEDGVLTALNDSRPEIAKAAGRVLAVLDSKNAQNGLAVKAADGATPADVRIVLYKSLANNAKFYGNRLDADPTAALEKTVTDDKNADVRSAAAEARGALNLPADQARTIILDQSKI